MHAKTAAVGDDGVVMGVLPLKCRASCPVALQLRALCQQRTAEVELLRSQVEQREASMELLKHGQAEQVCVSVWVGGGGGGKV